MKLNINTIVTVELTALGASEYNVWLSSVGSKANKREGDKLCDPLWHIMQVFGPNMHIGMPGVFFKDNEIDVNVKVDVRVVEG